MPERKITPFRIFNALQEFIEAGVSWLIYPLVAVMVAEIISRYVFASPLPWVRDVSTWLYATSFMLVVAHYYGKRLHISAEDLVYNFRLTESQRAMIDLFHNLILLSIAGFLFWPSIEAILRSIRIGELSLMGLWRPPLWPFRALIPITLLLLGLQGLCGLFKAIATLHKGINAWIRSCLR